MAAEADPNVEVWMLFTDIVLIYMALMLVRFGWLWTMKNFSVRFLKKKADGVWFVDHCELLIASFAGVRGAITLSPVCSPFRCCCRRAMSSRRVMNWSFTAAGVDPVLTVCQGGDYAADFAAAYRRRGRATQQHKEERIARAATAEVAIVAIQKMEERTAADAEENIDNQLLTEVSSRVIGICVAGLTAVTMWKALAAGGEP